MDTIKIIVSGAFKEKALLTSIIGDKLEEEGIGVIYNEPTINDCVHSKYDNLLSEFKENDIKVSLVVEDLVNTNVSEDLKEFIDELSTPYWKTASPEFNKGVQAVETKLRQILQI